MNSLPDKGAKTSATSQAEAEAEARAKIRAEAEANVRAELQAEIEAAMQAQTEARLRAKFEAKLRAEAEADQAKREKEEQLKAQTCFQNPDQVPRPDLGAQLISDNAVSGGIARHDDKSDAIQDKHTSPMIPYRNQSLSSRDESQVPSLCGRCPVPLSHLTMENE